MCVYVTITIKEVINWQSRVLDGLERGKGEIK